MNSKNTIIIGVLVLALIGGIVYSRNASSGSNKAMESSDVAMEKPTDAMMEKKDAMEKPADAMMMNESRYMDYTRVAFDSAKSKKRVYFFHASWCPTCKAANAEILGNLDGIPEDVIVFKTDYDSNAELKKQYGITYQHTFVLVDDMGKEVKKWNGGGLSELSANTK